MPIVYYNITYPISILHVTLQYYIAHCPALLPGTSRRGLAYYSSTHSISILHFSLQHYIAHCPHYSRARVHEVSQTLSVSHYNITDQISILHITLQYHISHCPALPPGTSTRGLADTAHHIAILHIKFLYYISHYNITYRVAKTHRIPYLYRSFSAKVTYI